MKVWGYSDALWETIWNSILRAVTTLGISSGLLCPAGSSWGWKLVTAGSQRRLRRASKITPNRLKITLGPHWWTKACWGCPPGACRTPRVYIYAYLCMYLCAFMHIHTYLCRLMPVFMRIHSYSCIFMHLSCIFHVYVCIFTHIYAYLCRFIVCLIQGKYIYS